MNFSYATPEDYLASAEAGGEDALDLSNLDSPSSASLDTGQLQDALEQGTREIEGILATRYPVAVLRAQEPPLSTLVDINITLAKYLLDARYGARDESRKRYEDALARLRRIARQQEELLGNDSNPLTFTPDQQATVTRGKVGRGNRRFTASSTKRLMGWDLQ